MAAETYSDKPNDLIFLQMMNEFERNGRLWFRKALTATDIQALEQVLPADGAASARLDLPSLCDILQALPNLTRIVDQFGAGFRPVRLVAFDKSADRNWTVPWHQDRVIAVADRADVEGFSNWSLKAGTWHCEPPTETLEKMLFARIHLDACAPSNGAMEIALGSHGSGKVEAVDAQRVASKHQTEICNAESGDVLILKMLTLHRSQPSQTASHRRALRVDFANSSLPAPLCWVG